MKTATVAGGFVMMRRVGMLLGACLLWLAWDPWSSAGAEVPTLGRLQAEMRARQFPQAVVTADALIAVKDTAMGEATYLKALALFHTGKFQESMAVSDTILAQNPKSDWQFKALYLKAQALVEQKQFKEAAAIYEAEANRILSPQRKQELAGVIIQFADKLTVTPAANDPGASPPDFNKAYGLYQKALTMEIGRDLRDEVMFKKSPCYPAGG